MRTFFFLLQAMPTTPSIFVPQLDKKQMNCVLSLLLSLSLSLASLSRIYYVQVVCRRNREVLAMTKCGLRVKKGVVVEHERHKKVCW